MLIPEPITLARGKKALIGQSWLYTHPYNPEDGVSPICSESGIVERIKGLHHGQAHTTGPTHLRILRSWNVGILESECRALELWKCVRIRISNSRSSMG